AQFIEKVCEKVENTLGHVNAIFVGLPGVKGANDNFVSFGQIAREFGDPYLEVEEYNTHIDIVNNAIETLREKLRIKNIQFYMDNDMVPWAYAIAEQGYTKAIAIVAGGGQGQICIQNGKPSQGNNEGGHQAYLPLQEKTVAYNPSSPPGSFESYGLGNPGIIQFALKQSNLEKQIREVFHFKYNDPIEVIHLGNILSGKTPDGHSDLELKDIDLQQAVKNKIWRVIADVEAEHLLFLYFYSGETSYVFAGGPVSGTTGDIFLKLLIEALREKIKNENLEIPTFSISSIETASPAERAAIAALNLYSKN
ncbi:MAG: hypothetical protein KDD40_12190, partial [Bdellovibrionales bacterium]|nr:hypothetical protein [Bdellovibrionales bacterium]